MKKLILILFLLTSRPSWGQAEQVFAQMAFGFSTFANIYIQHKNKLAEIQAKHEERKLEILLENEKKKLEFARQEAERLEAIEKERVDHLPFNEVVPEKYVKYYNERGLNIRGDLVSGQRPQELLYRNSLKTDFNTQVEKLIRLNGSIEAIKLKRAASSRELGTVDHSSNDQIKLKIKERDKVSEALDTLAGQMKGESYKGAPPGQSFSFSSNSNSGGAAQR